MSWRLLRSRLCAGLALVAYLAATVGFPLPAHAHKGGSAGSCQGGACGCPSDQQAAHTCCCCRPVAAKPACPHCQAAGEVAPCCQSSSGCSARAEEAAPQAESAPASPLRWVQGVSVMRCRGLSTLWVSSGAALPPPAVVTCDPAAIPLDWLSDNDDLGPCLSHTPPSPPPRSAGC